MSSSQIAPTFSPLAEWLFRIVPLAIAAAGFVFTMVTRYENRKKETIRWTSELVGTTPLSTGDPSIVVHIHNTGKRRISLVGDSYHLCVPKRKYYILELDPRITEGPGYAALLQEGDILAFAIKIGNLANRLLDPDTGLSKGDIVPLRLEFNDVEGRKYHSEALYSLSGFGLIEKDGKFRSRKKSAWAARDRIRKGIE